MGTGRTPRDRDGRGAAADGKPAVSYQVRGLGLLVGVELDVPAGPAVTVRSLSLIHI